MAAASVAPPRGWTVPRSGRPPALLVIRHPTTHFPREGRAGLREAERAAQHGRLCCVEASSQVP